MSSLKLFSPSLLGQNLMLLRDISEPVTERFSLDFCKQFNNNQILPIASNKDDTYMYTKNWNMKNV